MVNRDVIIIGGGIAGLTTAVSLLSRGASVVLLDRSYPGHGATYVAAGMLAPLVESRLEERELLTFGVEALNYWATFSLELMERSAIDCNYRTDGTLMVAVERDHAAQLTHLHREHQELGLSVEQLSGYECRQLEPRLAPTLSGGLYSRSDGQVNNRELVRALVKVISDSPEGEILPNVAIGSITGSSSNGWSVQLSDRHVSSEQLVIATGAEFALVEPFARGLTNVIRPVKGEILRLDQSQSPMISHVIRTPDVYLVPKSDGMVVVGATSDERGFDRTVRAGGMYELLKSAWETVPGTYELPIIDYTYGFRPATPDHLPLLGRIGPDGPFVATGYYRHGILFGPLAGELLAELLLNGEEDERIAAFRPDRFDRDSA